MERSNISSFIHFFFFFFWCHFLIFVVLLSLREKKIRYHTTMVLFKINSLFVILVTTLLLYLFGTCHGKCSFELNFGSSNSDYENSGIDEGFAAAAQAVTTCDLSCSGSPNGNATTTLMLGFGGVPNDDGAQISSTFEGCSRILQLTVANQQKELGWRVRNVGGFTDMTLACSCSNSCDTCFSGDTTVEVEHKGPVLMKNLQIGDRVMMASSTTTSSSPKYQPVYSFGHHNPTKEARFYQLFTSDSIVPLEMTGQHLIFVMKSDEKQKEQVVRVDEVHVGDWLLRNNDEKVLVTKISTIEKQGVYMPLTQDGTILVNNGLKASTYVSIADQAPTVVKNTALFHMNEQSLSHWWLAPHRMLCLGISERLCRATEYEGQVLPYLMSGRDYAEFAEPYGFFMRVIVFGIPTFLFFGSLNLMEYILLGPAFAPTIMLLLGLFGYHQLQKKARNINKKNN